MDIYESPSIKTRDKLKKNTIVCVLYFVQNHREQSSSSQTLIPSNTTQKSKKESSRNRFQAKFVIITLRGSQGNLGGNSSNQGRSNTRLKGKR
ncbi:hypothetical protein HanPSC8_Chr17g0796501 [Helianthus annuus]|nr:hypothetical protein HanPSC8_Chr17g0796501 [Helianthus annuus]